MGTTHLRCDECERHMPYEHVGNRCPIQKCNGLVIAVACAGVACRAPGCFIPPLPEQKMTLPATTAARKAIPLASGCLDYFPAALAAVAALSKAGNDKHNPGQDLHWARGKSMDHADCIMRHLVDRGTVDPEDGISHSAKVAWRALALLQEELEAAGSPLARAARVT